MVVDFCDSSTAFEVVMMHLYATGYLESYSLLDRPLYTAFCMLCVGYWRGKLSTRVPPGSHGMQDQSLPLHAPALPLPTHTRGGRGRAGWFP